jgi:hypothetical protein
MMLVSYSIAPYLNNSGVAFRKARLNVRFIVRLFHKLTLRKHYPLLAAFSLGHGTQCALQPRVGIWCWRNLYSIWS